MQEEEWIQADAEVVEDVILSVDAILREKSVRVLEALTALAEIMICGCQTNGINKATLLSIIANQWELNDPETDHPMQGQHPIYRL